MVDPLPNLSELSAEDKDALIVRLFTAVPALIPSARTNPPCLDCKRPGSRHSSSSGKAKKEKAGAHPTIEIEKSAGSPSGFQRPSLGILSPSAQF